MARFNLIVDSNRNPLNLVLGNWSVVDSYARYVVNKAPGWKSMKGERAKFLTEFAQVVLGELNIPPPSFVGFTEHMGAFERIHWRIFLCRPLFAGIDGDGIAEQAGHVLHEYEHLASVYVACRYLAAKTLTDSKSGTSSGGASTIENELGVMKEIALAAFADPLPSELTELGNACLFRITSEKGAEGKPGYYEALQSNIRKSEAEFDSARSQADKLEQTTSSKDALFKAWTNEKNAKRSLQRALREYQLSENEIGSNLVEGQVKTRVLQLLAPGKR